MILVLHDVCYILDEDSSFELKAWCLYSGFVGVTACKAIFWFIGIHFLAAQQNPLEEIDLVLVHMS